MTAPHLLCFSHLACPAPDLAMYTRHTLHDRLGTCHSFPISNNGSLSVPSGHCSNVTFSMALSDSSLFTHQIYPGIPQPSLLAILPPDTLLYLFALSPSAECKGQDGWDFCQFCLSTVSAHEIEHDTLCRVRHLQQMEELCACCIPSSVNNRVQIQTLTLCIVLST